MDNEKIKEAWPGWEVVRLIGNGGFGSVYEIRREEYGVTEKAALKVITIPHSQSDIDDLYSDGYDEESITSHYQYYIEDIVKEYKLMKNLSGHSNIVDCDDYRIVKHTDDIGWDIFIKMELLIPLSKVLKNRNNAVDEELVVQIGQDVCQALVLCNSRKIVHRDIKPENIFVFADGNFKLGDFGIAKVATRTTSGTKTGTYKYMAPEVFNNEPYGDAADIYSLGLVLYWLMNEFRMPFMVLPPDVPTVAQREESAKRRFAGEPIPAPKNGSEMLKKIVLKACDFKPENRYHSAMEMLEDLNQVEAALLMDSGLASNPENSTVTGETVTGESAGEAAGGTWAANAGDHRYPDSPSGPSMTENSSRNNSFYGSGNSVYNSGEEPTVYNDSFRYEPEESFREEPSGPFAWFRKLSTPVLLGAGALIVVLALVILLGGKGDKHIISVFNDDDEVTSVDEPQTTTDANGNVIKVPGSSGKSGGSSGSSKSDSKSEDSGGVNLWDVIGGLFAGAASDNSSNSSNTNNSSNKSSSSSSNTNNTSSTTNNTSGSSSTEKTGGSGSTEKQNSSTTGGNSSTTGGDNGTTSGGTTGGDHGTTGGSTTGGDNGTTGGSTTGGDHGTTGGSTTGGDNGTTSGGTTGGNSGNGGGSTTGGDNGTTSGGTTGGDTGNAGGNSGTSGGDSGTSGGGTVDAGGSSGGEAVSVESSGGGDAAPSE